MIETIVGVVVVLVATAGGFYEGGKIAQANGRALLEALRERIHDRSEELATARARVAFLEQTIDEIRARQLETTPPPIADVTVPRSLPEEVEREIALVEDADGRDEYREQAFLIMEQFPELEPDAVISRLFD